MNMKMKAVFAVNIVAAVFFSANLKSNDTGNDRVSSFSKSMDTNQI